MKPLALNLSKMKKIGGDQHSSTFLHPSGHQMVIAHKGVSALQRKQLESMPVHKMADGGDTTPVNINNPVVPENLAQPQEIDLSKSDWKGEAADNAPYGTLPADTQPVQSDRVISSQSAPIPGDGMALAQAAPAKPLGGVDLAGAYGQGQRGISEQQAVDSQKAKAKEQIENDQVAQQKNLAQDFQDKYAHFNDQQQKFMQDYMNGHINPNHYVESMSTGSKIATAIGMILGGAASGTTGSNAGADWLNKQIDRDIQAQASRQDQQKTLLGANQALFHDNIMALNQTRANMNDIYDHQIQLAAAKIGTDQARATADTMHAKFAMENSALVQQNALRSAALNAAANGTAKPEELIPYLVPEAHQKDAIKEAGQARAAMENHDFLMKKFDDAAKENTILRTGAGKARVPEAISSMNALELPMIHDQEGRVNEFEQKTLQDLHPQPGDWDSKIAEKRIAYEQFLNNKRQTPTLSTFAPKLAAQFTANRVTHPAETQTMGGVKYQKVPGGWKKVQ